MSRAADRKQGRKQRLACSILWLALLIFGGMVFAEPFSCFGEEGQGQKNREAEGAYRNPLTGYQVWVEDKAELLTEEQLLLLFQIMEPITEYGNAAFVSVRSNSHSTEDFARSYFKKRFGTDSGTVFVIDMDHRKIWIHSDGTIYKTITAANANTVTDNVYRYASNGDYYGCAEEAFEEIYKLLKGQRIARPMKYISNLLLALSLSLLANFGLIIGFTRPQKPGNNILLSHIYRKFHYSKLKAVRTYQNKVYDPASSRGGSGGGGSSGGGSGGGGSGGSSGGGGGHSF